MQEKWAKKVAESQQKSQQICRFPPSFAIVRQRSETRIYKVRPRKDHRRVDLISDALPFGRLWYDEPNAASNAIGYAIHYSRSHDAVIRVYDDAGNVIETHEAAGEAGLGAITAAQQRPGFRSAFALTMRYGNSECGMGFGGWRGLRCAMNRQKNGADRAALASPGALFRQCGSRCGSQLAGVVLAMRPSGL